MRKGRVIAYILDGAVLATAAVAVALTQVYIADPIYRRLASVACGAIAILPLLAESRWALARRLSPTELDGAAGVTVGPGIRGLALLGEENNIVNTWALSGRSALIGRGGESAPVDIDLSGTEYGGLIDECHASLNLVGDKWYAEDLSSTNGTALARAGETGGGELAPGVPCRLEAGDEIILAGRARLLVR
jgi:hypothetical protein